YYFILSLLSHLFFYREKWRLYLRKGWLLNGMGCICRCLSLCDGRIYTHSHSNNCMLHIRIDCWVCLGFLKKNSDRFISWLITWIMEFIRSTPPLVQLFFLYYGLPVLPGVGVSL